MEILTMEQKIALFKETADNADKRDLFAQSLASAVGEGLPTQPTLADPIGKPINPQVSVRYLYQVKPLGAGQIAIFPKHFGMVEAWMLPRMGEIPQNFIVGDDIIIPTFEVTSSVEWKLSYVRDGRIDVVTEAIEQMRNAIIRQEEQAGWSVIRQVFANNGNADKVFQIATDNTLTKTLINAMITEQRTAGFEPDILYMSPKSAGDIRDWEMTKIDNTTQREIFVGGGLGSIWNVEIRELRSLGDDEVYLFDTKRMGLMPVRQELTTFDIPDAIKRLRAGVLCFEEIGFSIFYPKAIVKGVIARS